MNDQEYTMHIVVAGGTGLIGQRLVDRLVVEGHRVTVLSRSATPPSDRIRKVAWNGQDPGPWTAAVDEADAVVNMAGTSIAGGRWTTQRKRVIMASRVDATRAIVDALLRAPQRHRVLVNASAVGYYGNVEEGDVTESHAPGTDFLATVCHAWEEEAVRAERGGVRVVTLRSGMVLDAAGGALARLVLPFRFFVGGPLGSGRQWLPWIHHEDMAGAILHLMKNPALSGPFNMAAPEAVRMRELCAMLGRVLRRPSWAPVPAWVLQALLGEMSGVVLTGQKAVPDKLLAGGYRFRFGTLEEALRDVMRR